MLKVISFIFLIIFTIYIFKNKTFEIKIILKKTGLSKHLVFFNLRIVI